jgi:hypothetical protein
MERKVEVLFDEETAIWTVRTSIYEVQWPGKKGQTHIPSRVEEYILSALEIVE